MQYMHPSMLLAFLNVARGTDEDRPMLQKIGVHHSFLVSADGFRLHAVRFPAEAEAELRDETDIEPETLCNITLDIPNNYEYDQPARVVATEKESGNTVLLDTMRLKAIIPPENRAGYFAVDREFLLDALRSMPDDIDYVILETPKNNTSPMCIYAGGGYFAIIMPRHLESVEGEIWRPL